jgi:hypothetical protein
MKRYGGRGLGRGKEYQAFSLDRAMDHAKLRLEEYWGTNPGLRRSIERKKQKPQTQPHKPIIETPPAPINVQLSAEPTPLFETALRGAELRARLYESHCIVRENIVATGSAIVRRTQAHNRKSPHLTIEEARAEREALLAAQIEIWRNLLPHLLAEFSKLKDYRDPRRIEHKITVLMLFGLLAFVFQLQSRRQMNHKLTEPAIMTHLKKLFPELDSIPHADTLTRLLEHLNPKSIEAIGISLIRQLIRKKKFTQMLIEDCLPITIDGAQKLYRQGLRHDERWLERNVGKGETQRKQQYVYVLEANITLQNGLTIPLMSEYLYREHSKLEEEETKQDCEVTAAERLLERLKKYFPRLKIIIFADALFATQTLMDIINKNRWHFMIRLPKDKLTDFAKILRQERDSRIMLREQPFYRERQQSFYWVNDETYGYDYQLKINLIACFEEYEVVNPKTAKIEKQFSEHAWISSIPASVENVHTLTNLGARKAWLIEHSFNVEKNQGYHYKHVFSYEWHAMQGFHYLMRLGHAINALSEFCKTIKRFVKELGCAATADLIRETLFTPWIPVEWYVEQRLKNSQLRLQLE